MKSLLKLGAVVCLLASVSLGQGVRFGDANPTQTTTSVPGISGKFLIVIPNATINFCHAPANAVPCTNKQTAYTDATLSTACSNSTQIVLAGTNNCVGSTDSLGNWGVWVPSGVYEYTLSTGGLNYGPFEAVIASGGLGNQKSVPNCTAAGTVLDETVQETSQVVAGVTQTCATVGAISSTGIIGICQSSCGNSGPAIVATGNTNLCIFDNQATQGDYVVPSSSVPGFCSDAGAVKPSSAIETLGIVSIANVGGAGNAGTVQVAPLSLLLPGSNGGSGIVTNCASASGANAFYPGVGTIVSCDPLVTDSNGVLTMNGANFVDNTFGGYFRQQQGPLPGLSAPNSVYYSPGAAVGTTYGIQPFATPPTVGDCLDAAAGDSAGWIKFHDSGNPCGTGAGGGTTKTGNPVIPVATVNGTPASTDYKYAVVGCEDPACSRHTAISPVVDVTTGAATITSTNSITLKTYGDTLYGIRGYIVCRTASSGTPATTGVITGVLIAGKQFIDTGLAGDSTNCAAVYASNNTQLNISDDALPGCNVPSTRIGGPDAPPCTPTLFDDEFQQSFGAPADVNNAVWTWGNQGGAVASFSSGLLVIIPDTANSLEYVKQSVALPAPPYTFKVYVDVGVGATTSGSGNGCYVGLKESGTGKISNLEIVYLEAGGSVAASGGFVWDVRNSTSNTPGSAPALQSYNSNAGYLQIQNTGASLIYKASPSGDGVAMTQQFTQAVTTPFTTAPDTLILGALGAGGGNTTCSFDFERRTQ